MNVHEALKKQALAQIPGQSAPTLMYHVAPQAARGEIASDNGLWAGESPDLGEEGVYLFDHPSHAQRFAGQHPELHPHDIWEVGVHPQDRQVMVQDPMEDGGWIYQEPFLEAQSLRVT